MTNTAARLFAQLDAAHPTITATASALGITKQAYSIARQRGSISDALCIRVCALLRLDPAQAIVDLHRDAATTPDEIAVWENIRARLTPPDTTTNHNPGQSNPCPDQQPENQPNQEPGNHRRFCIMSTRVDDHVPHPLSRKSKMVALAEKVCKWMLCVPRMKTTSPRFEYYADNWNILDKIRRFTDSGEFDTLTKDCPAFDGEELRAALDYLARRQPTDKAHEEPSPAIKPLWTQPRQRVAR